MQTEAFTHSKLSHREALTQRSIYTEELLHTHTHGDVVIVVIFGDFHSFHTYPILSGSPYLVSGLSPQL